MDVLIFGDSITQGAFDEECGGWANRLAAITYKSDVESDLENRDVVFNLGISGDDVADIFERFEAEIQYRSGKEFEQKLVLLAVGVNDSQVNIETKEHRTEIETFQDTYQKIIERIQEIGHVIVCVGLSPIDEEILNPMPWKSTHAYQLSEVEKYDAIIKTVAEEHNAVFIPMLDVFDPNKKYLVDGIHPNAEGHRLICERIRNVLKERELI